MSVGQAASGTRRRGEKLDFHPSSIVLGTVWTSGCLRSRCPNVEALGVFISAICSISEKTSHEQPSSRTIHLYKWLLHPLPQSGTEAGAQRLSLLFTLRFVSHWCFAVSQACFEQQSPAVHPLVSMKHWSCETMTSHVSLEKVGRCLLCTLSLGLPERGAPPKGTTHPLARNGCVLLPSGRQQRHRPSA